MPEAHRTPELEDLIEWLGETVRQTDSSLLDEWEALSDPDHVVQRGLPPRAAAPAAAALEAGARLPGDAPQRDVAPGSTRSPATTSTAWSASSARPPTAPTRRAQVVMSRSVWDAALEDYYAEHDPVLTDGDARGPDLLLVGGGAHGEPVGAEEGTSRGCATYARRSTTPRATTTG